MHFNKLTSMLVCAGLLIVCSASLRSNEMPKDSTTFRFVIEGGTGYIRTISASRTPLGEHTRGGLAGTLRLKWGSSHMLGVGIETGWMHISTTEYSLPASEFGPMDLHATLSAIPLLATFSIQRMGIQLHTGFGYYRVLSNVTLQGVAMNSGEWNMGFLISLGYAVPITSDMRLGGELKWNIITEQQVSLLSLQVRVLWMAFDR